ncbi:three-helix bundle dimerization domain-containing protein [Microbacterium rhizomatis]|uniref:DUF3562 domain-containing protein n=1 Tax=Microbacterium rhizomatis TaxID=1631477 RepID=A0A5J5J1R6_9MICO|nr:hypothetical protein [Microbacterium rhizomatis]KAA9107934.1 hypothetical protein F6B43_10945 [Microbacterium rhizomatis]
MSVTNPRDEAEALYFVVDRLSRRFDSVDESVVRELVVDAFVDFDDVPIRSYVTLLVEGEVRRRLRERTNQERPVGHHKAA